MLLGCTGDRHDTDVRVSVRVPLLLIAPPFTYPWLSARLESSIVSVPLLAIPPPSGSIDIVDPILAQDHVAQRQRAAAENAAADERRLGAADAAARDGDRVDGGRRTGVHLEQPVMPLATNLPALDDRAAWRRRR